MPAGAVDEEEREKIGRVELSLSGVVDDVDEMFLSRGEMSLWKQVAFDALMRGWIWGKFGDAGQQAAMGTVEESNEPIPFEKYCEIINFFDNPLAD